MTPIKSYDAVIIGAGLSGLAAADYLEKAGAKVLIVERTDKVGGRVLTHHLPTNQHFELGAFSFGNKESTLWKYIHRFSLKPHAHTQFKRMFSFEGIEGGIEDFGTFLESKERTIPLNQLMNHFRKKIEELLLDEDLSFAESLRKVGASENAIRWLEKNTLAGLLGDGFEDTSTRAMLVYLKQYDDSTQYNAFEGGNDQLPNALAQNLKSEIIYNSQVKKVEKLTHSCLIHWKGQTVEAKNVIFAVPIPALQTIEISPPLSLKKREAMQSVSYTSCTRMSIVAPPGVFGKPRGGGFITSDEGWFREQTAFQKNPQKSTVLNISIVGKKAREISHQQWQNKINQILKKESSSWDPSRAIFFYHSWNNVEWIKGGYAYFKPKTFHLQKVLKKSEGPFHFAGEHTSKKFASMNGALESGLRAAKELCLTHLEKGHFNTN